MLPDWISHPHAGYVLASYGLAFLALGCLAALTWLARRKSEQALSSIKNIQKRHCEEPSSGDDLSAIVAQ
ncbi:MAG: heme exporter protein CcmD, partial [Bdellovibrionales bacterium]